MNQNPVFSPVEWYVMAAVGMATIGLMGFNLWLMHAARV
jgi:hypothetical protein